LERLTISGSPRSPENRPGNWLAEGRASAAKINGDENAVLNRNESPPHA
jgi:hypothetical protein